MVGALSYAVLQDESAWGTVGSGVDHYLPLTSFGLTAELATRDQEMRCGILQPRYSEKVRRTVRGTISLPLYGQFAPTATKSFAEYVMDWAFGLPVGGENSVRPSKSLHWFDSVAGARWSGLRVDEATLSGDTNGITLSLSLIGKDESASALTPTLPDDRAKLSEFLFGEASLVFDGSTLPIDSFQWSVSHSLALRFNDSYTPSSLVATGRQESLTIKPLKSNTTYTALQRLSSMSHKAATLTISGRHEGTGGSGTKTQLAAAFARLAILNVEDLFQYGEYNWQPIRCNVLKPQSGSAAVAKTWSLV